MISASLIHETGHAKACAQGQPREIGWAGRWGPGCSLEGLMLKLKLQYFGHLMRRGEKTHWKRPWCWEGLGAGGEGDDRGWDGWMASLTPWTWVWVNSRSWWWTGRPGMLWFMGSQRVGQDWATELNWTELTVTDWVFELIPNKNSVISLLVSYSSCCMWWVILCVSLTRPRDIQIAGKMFFYFLIINFWLLG